MGDEFLTHFSWITLLLERQPREPFRSGSPEQAVLDDFRKGWGHLDTAALLRGLSERHGPIAAPTIEHFLASCIMEDWKKTGSIEAHPGTEIQDFIRILWEPLQAQGFSFTQREADGRVEFSVTRCPVYELAERAGLHTWLYHLACATDFYTATAFSAKIGFCRTKTLMEGHECCDHTYIHKP